MCITSRRRQKQETTDEKRRSKEKNPSTYRETKSGKKAKFIIVFLLLIPCAHVEILERERERKKCPIFCQLQRK